MSRRLAVLVAALAAAATVLVAAPANAAAYGVSLSVSRTSADVGTTVTLSGKVTGKSSTGRTVYLQRRSGSTWSTVTTTKTTSKSTYSKSVKIPEAGANPYRAVVKATSTVDRGQSTTRTVTGWTWVDLHAAAYLSDGFVQRGWHGQLNGRTPPRQTFALSGDAWLNWRLESLCDRATGTLEQPAGASAQTVTVVANGTALYTVGEGPRTVDVSLTDAHSLTVRRDDGGGYVAFLAPKAHCSVAVLPIAYD